MKSYTLEDGFEFVTDNDGLVVKTKYPKETLYREEKDFRIYAIGSIATDKKHNFSLRNISIPPKRGEHLVVKEKQTPESASPTKIISIDDHFSE
ncbi:MAG: hypothetical protein AABX51_00710 [Nanoarchaeota archaeon]